MSYPSLHVMISLADTKYTITLERIKTIVITFFGVRENVFSSNSRKHDAVVARTFYAVLCRKILPNETLKSIGKGMGNRDHSTTISCLKRFKDYGDLDVKFKHYFENLRAMILRETIPYPRDIKYIPEKPIAEKVSEIIASQIDFDEVVVEEKIERSQNGNGYSHNTDQKYLAQQK